MVDNTSCGSSRCQSINLRLEILGNIRLYLRCPRTYTKWCHYRDCSVSVLWEIRHIVHSMQRNGFIQHLLTEYSLIFFNHSFENFSITVVLFVYIYTYMTLKIIELCALVLEVLPNFNRCQFEWYHLVQTGGRGACWLGRGLVVRSTSTNKYYAYEWKYFLLSQLNDITQAKYHDNII